MTNRIEPRKGDRFFWEGLWLTVERVTERTMRCVVDVHGFSVTFHDKERALRSGRLKRDLSEGEACDCGNCWICSGGSL